MVEMLKKKVVPVPHVDGLVGKEGGGGCGGGGCGEGEVYGVRGRRFGGFFLEEVLGFGEVALEHLESEFALLEGKSEFG